MIVIDGNGMIFGRIASRISKELLKKNQIILVNAEKILISGDPKAIVDRYTVKRSLKNKANPEKSSHFSRVPKMFVKRIIRGMLPWKRPRGKEAYRNLTVYEGIPENITQKPVVFEDCRPKNISKYITIEKICKRFGYGG
ncbi:MAG: 50S ribosomal protein L13 [Candidatus Micrarchaeia archaeon]